MLKFKHFVIIFFLIPYPPSILLTTGMLEHFLYRGSLAMKCLMRTIFHHNELFEIVIIAIFLMALIVLVTFVMHLLFPFCGWRQLFQLRISFLAAISFRVKGS